MLVAPEIARVSGRGGQQQRSARGLGSGVARATASDGRSALAAAKAVASRASGARWTLHELEISIAGGIALECSCGGRWHRSARSLSCPVFRQPCCRPTGRHQSRPPSSSRSIRGAFDAPRLVDADRAADRPQRRPWWAVASICARLRLRPSHAVRRLDTRTRLAAVYVAAGRCTAALSTHRGP